MDKQSDDPGLPEWKELYEAALSFKEIAPWGWMDDSDIFGVKNPLDQEIGYCSILGGAGKVFGLMIYIGPEGFRGYVQMMEAKEEDAGDTFLSLRSLTMTFEAKKFVKKPDIKIIEELGLILSGKNGWPVFMSHKPGYYPWPLTRDEAVFLIVCLRQAAEVSLRLKHDKSLLFPPGEKRILVREPEAAASGPRWLDTRVIPAPLKEITVIVKSNDGDRFEHILKTASRTGQTWEIDYFYASMSIGGKGERPYFPVAFLVVDKESFYILNAHVTEPDAYEAQLHDQLLAAIEKSGMIPREVRIRKEQLRVLLGHVTSRLGIKVEISNTLSAVDDARKSMFEHFRKRG